MATFHARRGQVSYGYSIGMLCAEWHIPFIPGDLNNANTFDFPVDYLSVPGVSGASVLAGHGHRNEQLFVDAARRLESRGVRAITGNCGFMAVYQQAVADAVRVPVFMSSLLQAPLLLSMLGGGRKLGVLVASAAAVNGRVLDAAGIGESERVVLEGLDHRPHWREVIIDEVGMLDEERIRDEVVATAMELLVTEPEIGGFLLECSDLPPYTHAVHAATGLPVFDWAGFIRYVHQAVVPTRYCGIT